MWNWLKCRFIILGGHDYTCALDEGIKATPEQLESVDGFFDYAKMYCKNCGHVYVPESKRNR